MYYDGGLLINDSETRTELAESEITKINQALIQYDPAVEDEKNSAPADLVVDGDESSVSDFLIEHLNEYIQSRAIWTEKRITKRSPATKADCSWAVNGDTYDHILLIVDYSSGKVYDEFTVDDDWQNKENSVEQQIGVLLHSILNSDDYDGGIILTDSETRTELSESEIAKINQALKQ